jgi:hypothetical protein
LNAEVRQEDIVARTGTARFCLLLPGMNMSGIHNLAERISVRVRTSPVKEGEKRINVTISIGVATPEIRRDTRLEDLLSEAASHLSRASSGGGNQAVIDDSRHDHTGSYTFEPAGKAAMPVEAIIDILHGADTTEIEIGIPQGFEPGENPQTEELTLECRETADPASLPATFAGPVSETPQVARDGFPAENGPDSTTAFGGLSILDPEAPQGKAVFAIEDDESGPDETIIITAPFDVHSTSEAENTRETLRMSQSVSTPSAKTQVTPSAPPEQNSDVIPETEVKGQEDIEEIPVRPGFMRRILRAIFSPFGRRKPD